MAKKRAHGEGTISKRKDGRWEGRVSAGYNETGTPKRRAVYGRTQAEVKKKLDVLKQQVDAGTYTDTKLTVAAFLERHLAEKARDLKPSTLEQYEICVRRCIVPSIGRVKLDKLTPMQVQTLIGEVRDASGTARAAKCRTVLLSAYRQAIRLQLVTRNPVEAVDPIPAKPREMSLWEAEEAARFLGAACEHRPDRLFLRHHGDGSEARRAFRLALAGRREQHHPGPAGVREGRGQTHPFDAEEPERFSLGRPLLRRTGGTFPPPAAPRGGAA